MRKQNSSTAGFTIVELLIVIVVIAILATISIVAYRGIQERARASEATSGLAQAKKKLELYKVDNSTYPTSGNLASAGVTDTDVSYQYTSDGSAYCLTATVGTTSYKATNTTTPNQGGCAGHGQGGQPAITNLSLDPKGVGTAYWFVKLDSTMTDTPNVSWGERTDWHRFVRNFAAGNTFRMSMTQADLTNGQTYTVSALLANPSAGTITGGIDFCDQGSIGFSLAPGESRRVSTSGSRATYDSTYRFFDIALTSNTPEGLLVTDAMVTKGSTAYTYADGNSPNWIWNGSANNSTSTGPAL